MPHEIGNVLVVGAGIGGIRSALDLAQSGCRVLLIDRSPRIGGILAQLDRQFPSNRCGMCKMLPWMQRDDRAQFCLRKGLFHEHIEIAPATELTGLKGEPGRFKVRLRQTGQGVDPTRCVGCGLCETVCPVDIADDFNAGLGKRKAIYLPLPHSVPNPYVIDAAACTRCGACEQICPVGAVNLAADGRSDFGILVVDDERVVRDSLREWLVNEGFTAVETAESGSWALEMLAQGSFQLLLTDIKMPGMDGVELLKQAKAALPDLTVIMMTAYATVETAVEAMKIGALDYFMKPFDPAAMVNDVRRLYEAHQASRDREVDVQAVILAAGTDFFNPAQGANPYAYTINPHVLTQLEFERLLSGTGPGAGTPVRPADGKPIRKVAWLQCVGSRDIQADADFCSSICCMVSLKQALLLKEKCAGAAEAAIFHMDLRTTGKDFQCYRDTAESEHGVRLERARIHSVLPDPAGGAPLIRAVAQDGSLSQERFDLVVLAVGQRPVRATGALSGITAAGVNTWGFFTALPFAPAHTTSPGIFLSGAAGGQQDIGRAMILASAAAAEAGRVVHEAGYRPASASGPRPPSQALLNEPPRIHAVICTCGARLQSIVSCEELSRRLEREPMLQQVVFMDKLCTGEGWHSLEQHIRQHQPNRLLVGACHPHLFLRKLRELSESTSLPRHLMEVVDLELCRRPAQNPVPDAAQPDGPSLSPQTLYAGLGMGLAMLRHADPEPRASTPVVQRALVVGGGVAGLQAALTIADRGYGVDLVEISDQLGGNLRRLHQTLEGHPVAPFLNDMLRRIETLPLVQVHTAARIIDAGGHIGDFNTSVQTQDGQIQSIRHGVVLLATGAREAPVREHGYGTHAKICTQLELEEQLAKKTIDPTGLDSVVMIQCVGSREAPRNFCSRVCCPMALKHALGLKEKHPQIAIYILYRDLMATGFAESYYTLARRKGVIFIAYDVLAKPQVITGREDTLTVRVSDPVLGRKLEITTDLVVLATGVAPQPPVDLFTAFGARCDADGFFQPAESKWRPVDSLAAGVFSCGLALAPQTIDESIAGAQAAAQRALHILMHETLPAARVTAVIRDALCARCRRCIDACPYQARRYDCDADQIVINPAVCQGCGVCAAVCPNGAAVLRGFTKPRMLDTITAALGN